MSLFITFEGPEGSGKSTQARILYDTLQEQGYPVILVREPGGTRIGDMIRRIVLDMQHTEMDATTEILLFSAARAQLVNEKIRPYLAFGGVVLCDRYADSTYAYQGYGLGRSMADLRQITELATGGLQPHRTFFLDIHADEGLERKRAKRFGGRTARPETADQQSIEEWNRLDDRELAFHQRVEAGYRELIAAGDQRWALVDARQSVEAIAATIRQHLAPLLEHVRRLEPRPDSE